MLYVLPFVWGENITQNMLFGKKSQFQAVLRQFQAVLGNFVIRPILLPNLTTNKYYDMPSKYYLIWFINTGVSGRDIFQAIFRQFQAVRQLGPFSYLRLSN